MSCRRLEIHNLTLALADGSRTLVDDLSLQLEGGASLAVVGESGAGKSTLNKVLTGSHPKDGGTIDMDDHAIATNSPRDAQSHHIPTVYQ